jgi:hypothetical protein
MNQVTLTVPAGAAEAAILTGPAQTFLTEMSARFEPEIGKLRPSRPI